MIKKNNFRSYEDVIITEVFEDNHIKYLRVIKEESTENENKTMLSNVYSLLKDQNAKLIEDTTQIEDTQGDIDKLSFMKRILSTIGPIQSFINYIKDDLANLNPKYSQHAQMINDTLLSIKANHEFLIHQKAIFISGYHADSKLIKYIYTDMIIAISMGYNLSIKAMFLLQQLLTPALSSGNKKDEVVDKVIDTLTLIYNQLNKLELFQRSGNFKKFLDYLNSTNHSIKESGIIFHEIFFFEGPLAIILVGIGILLSLKFIVRLYFNMKQKISDIFEEISVIFDINLQSLKSKNGDIKIIKRQEAIVKKFNELSQKLQVKPDEIIKSENKENDGLRKGGSKRVSDAKPTNDFENDPKITTIDIEDNKPKSEPITPTQGVDTTRKPTGTVLL